MHLVIGIIRTSQLDSVMDNLSSVGIEQFTVIEARGHGQQKGASDLYGNVEYVGNYVPKLKVEVIVPDDKVISTTQAIIVGGKTGKAGDGLVYSLPLNNVRSIKTGNPF